MDNAFMPMKILPLRTVITVLALCFLTGRAAGQLSVVQGAAMNMTPLQLVQTYLVGAGVTVSNVTFNGNAGTINSDQVGTFTTTGVAANQLGLAGGILMTSGKASIAIGPNNAGGAGSQVNGPGDPDLNMLSGSNTFDKAVIEFDFVPQFDTIRFRYVFGSEEFFEYCNQFNDAFGFFLSGPGITGTFSNNSVNIARMPGSLNNYVTINNICANTNSRWTNNNGQYFQYDGLTFVFTAWYVVQPCTTYHIKLAIGDAVDKAWDSGVFLEQNSFSSPGVNMSNHNTVPGLGNRAVENCNDVAVNFKLMARLNYPYTVHYTISGNAINGTDYTQINDFVTFPPGSDSVNVIIHPISDNIAEGQEMVILTLNQVSCDGIIKRDTVWLEDYSPLGIVPNPDTTLCYGGEIVLNAQADGGIPPLQYLWNTGSTDSTLVFTPPVGTHSYSVRVTDVCSQMVRDTALITVHPVPVAQAGTNVTIPNGTSTTLHGSASGGYGNYSYSWTSNPPGFTSPLPEPNTGNLAQTRIFILKVTDLLSGCESEPAQVIVSIEGGPLSANPVSNPGEICLGDTARLYSLSGGGSGFYTYNWTSSPPGFASTAPDPLVTPGVTTTYTLTVNDGFNQVGGSATVVVHPLPLIRLGPPDTTACIYDTVRLDAGNPGSLYKWSNGSTGRYLTTSTTGIGYDMQTYSVTVTNQNGCRNTSSINIIFSFDDCVGIGEKSRGPVVSIFPNPANRSFRLKTTSFSGPCGVEVTNLLGKSLIRETFLSSGELQEHEFEIPALPAGVYPVRVGTREATFTLKLLVR